MINLNVFIAAPISGFNDNKLYVKYRENVISLIMALRQEAYTVFSELEKFNDLNGYDDPGAAILEDFKKITESDIFILLHPLKMQTSSFIELGYALAQKKKIIIISEKENLPFLALGLPNVINEVSIVPTNELNQNAIQTILKIIEAGS